MYNELPNKLQPYQFLYIVYAAASTKSFGTFPTSYAIDELQNPLPLKTI